MKAGRPRRWRWVLALALLPAFCAPASPAWGQSAAPQPKAALPKSQEAAPQKAPTPPPKAQPATPKKARETAPQEKEQETPLHITSTTLEADQEKNLILFKGQVKAVQGDATLYADELWVFYKPKEGGQPAPGSPEASPLGDLGGEKLDRIEAKGNVRYVQDDRVATGKEGIYYQDRDEIVLLGNPQVWRGENHLKGEKIIYNRRTKRVVVESSSKQRVEAHLYQTGQAGAQTPPGPLPGAKPATPKAPKVPKGHKPLPH